MFGLYYNEKKKDNFDPSLDNSKIRMSNNYIICAHIQ